MSVNIHTVNITCEDGLFTGNFELRVHDRENVREVMAGLKSINDIKDVKQIK